MRKNIFLFIILSFFVVSLIFSNAALAECSATSGDPMGCIPTDVPIGNDIEVILINILNASLDLLFLVVLGFLIYGGYFWMTSMGNEEKIKKSKQILTASIVGLIIVLLSLSIVDFVSKAIGITPEGLPNDTGLFGGTLSQALTSIINQALTLVGVVSLAVIVYGGFRWMTSMGNEETIGEAKRTLTAGVIGVIIIAISWSVVNLIITTVG